MCRRMIAMHGNTDALTPLAHEIINAAQYTRLVVPAGDLPEPHPMLAQLAPEQLLMTPVVSPTDAQALLAGLWLWHDQLDRSHTLSQEIHTPTGSFWHAIMHRREGDFSNAKYWYARCQGHPVFRSIAAYANDVLHPLPADKSLLRLMRDGWDPDAFVDLAEQVHDRPADLRHGAAVVLQKLEWRLLFQHCMRTATGQ